MSTPATMVVTDDLHRSRLTVFFRALLAIPHFVWLFLWGLVASVAILVNWLATLFTGTPPQGLHAFLSRYLRYQVHVVAYVSLLANRFPGFGGAPGYEVDVELPPPARQNRWTVFFRIVLGYPALILAAVLTGVYGILMTVVFLGWFVAMVRAEMPRGMRDAGIYGLGYMTQVSAYLFVLSDRYPNSDPAASVPDPPARQDPIGLVVEDDLRRSRLTVFFRLLLVFPHFVWLYLWGVVVLVAAVINWIATLIAGQSPDALHRFIGAWLRYQTHVLAYLTLAANPFPGFTGKPGSYPVDLVIAPRARQNRWKVLFRYPLVYPAAFLSSAYSLLLWSAALFGWFAAMVRGEMPLGLRNAIAIALRYQEQLNCYLFLMTDRYPYTGPVATAPPAAAEPPPLPQDPLAATV